ncbi:hypothetical protein MPLA_1280075 [Mesorhizobium sp. ORS 3359]|nr:hypothetical protein MPLA_1280075 [Mesorhizobium sp. ORS 3359]
MSFIEMLGRHGSLPNRFANGSDTCQTSLAGTTQLGEQAGLAVSLDFKWSEWRDSNTRPPDPKSGALPGCATLRRPAAYRGRTPGRQHKNGARFDPADDAVKAA